MACTSVAGYWTVAVGRVRDTRRNEASVSRLSSVSHYGAADIRGFAFRGRQAPAPSWVCDGPSGPMDAGHGAGPTVLMLHAFLSSVRACKTLSCLMAASTRSRQKCRRRASTHLGVTVVGPEMRRQKNAER